MKSSKLQLSSFWGVPLIGTTPESPTFRRDSGQARITRLKQGGFTLIELLVVLAVIGSIMAIVVGTVASVVRGTNKTNTINKVRENGNYAISQMARTIRSAKTIEMSSPPFVCQLIPETGPTPTPVKYKAVRTIPFDGNAIIFVCNDSTDSPPQTIVAGGESLLDTTSTVIPTPVPDNCFFTCIRQRVTDSPTIGINFTLISKTTSTLFETQASIPFAISIKGRN